MARKTFTAEWNKGDPMTVERIPLKNLSADQRRAARRLSRQVGCPVQMLKPVGRHSHIAPFFEKRCGGKRR